MIEPLRMDALLIDIDGVLVISGQPVPGATEAFAELHARAVPHRLLTNTTTASRAALGTMLRKAGLPVEDVHIVTAPVATSDYLRRRHPGRSCFLIAKGDVVEDLQDLDLVEHDADVVLIAGAEENFTYERLNRALGMLNRGAALVAMHRNLWWMTAEGPRLDAGAFIAGLEAASGVEAEVVGKPSPAFFQAALHSLGTRPEGTAMVGDDLLNDTLAAQELGLVGVQVRTGKFRDDQLQGLDRMPERIIDSFADLPGILL